jgi:putative resolvase
MTKREHKLVCEDKVGEKTPEQELRRDSLMLIASFSGRLYGMRSHNQQALVACAKQVMAEQEG